MLFTLDLQGNLIRWNHTMERVTGYSANELLNKHALEFVPPAEREPTTAAIQQAFRDGYAELDGHLLTKDGRTISYHWIGAPVKNSQGHVIGLTGVGRDITARKYTEEMLRRQEQDLRAAIEERARISEDLHDGILQSIFVVGLSLESCGTLVSKLPLQRKTAAAPLRAALSRAIGQLNHVMSDVRNFIAGIDSQVLQGGDVDSTLRAMVQAMCASYGIACRVTIEAGAVRELSTEQAYHVRNLLREALSNSLRHSGANRITVSFKRLRRSMRLSVADNGKGFIPDSVRDIGHGLANMEARARKLGGLIEVLSRPRQGTKVRLDIPKRPADE